MKRIVLIAAAIAGVVFAAQAQPTQRQFSYYAPGALIGSGERGTTERKVYFPDMQFPIEFDPSAQQVVLNSQVYNPGGACHSAPCSWSDADMGADGRGQCSPTNFAMPWRDTFCERGGRRNRDNPMCHHDPTASHQGVDIRAPTCQRARWDAVAVENGTIAYAGGHVVRLKTPTGVTYIYRHLDPASIANWKVDDEVRRGDTIGRISNILSIRRDGSRSYTTTHLHLEAIRADANGRQSPWPLYTSLVSAYRRAIGLSSGVDEHGLLEVDEERELAAAN